MGGLSPPPELLPIPSALRRRRTFAEIARLVLAWIIAIQLCYLSRRPSSSRSIATSIPPSPCSWPIANGASAGRSRPRRPVQLPGRSPATSAPCSSRSRTTNSTSITASTIEAFARAREINKRLGRPLYGGSTLTMQVARTLFLVPAKSYVRKYLEVLTALELEALLPKNRILELYFGYAEWGKGLFGIEAASRKWYGRGISRSLARRGGAPHRPALLAHQVRAADAAEERDIAGEVQVLSSRFDPQAQAASAAPTEGSPLGELSPPPSTEPGDDSEPEAPSETPAATPPASE